MALITHGSISQFSAAAAGSVGRPSLGPLRTFSALKEATREVQPLPLELTKSASKRGLALKSLRLTEGFEGFLQDVFNPTNEVYFLSWGWDLSGEPPFERPGLDAAAASLVIPTDVGQVREFLGAGALLFPARQVTAGLAVRIMVWESDQHARDFGKTLSEVSSTIKSSNLTNLLNLVAMGTGVTAATLALVADAAVELADVIGAILKANSDDYVDLYEGYYAAEEAWDAGEESYSGHASEIVLTRIAG